MRAPTLTYDVLITGSAGHLGHALMLFLPSLGYRPLGIDILPSSTTSFVGSFADRTFISHILSTNRGIRYVIHAGGLHKPHIISHTNEEFITTNITGTNILVDEVSKCRERISFVYVSTTSAFGSVLSPSKGQPAVWVDESLISVPKNIYGLSKTAAEDVCQFFHTKTGMPIIVLRVSRFFQQPDDETGLRKYMSNDNIKVLELCYRRVDIHDVVQSCICAMEKASQIGFAKYVISAPSPFAGDAKTLQRLNSDARGVLEDVLPGTELAFRALGWEFLDAFDRIYDSSRAQVELGWKPVYTFQAALEKVMKGEDWRSELAVRVGRRGYHAVTTALYTYRELPL
ncbi:NAD(P)-binding protein [Pseudovirgaria hyperparasitica]|uniref:NAD(P)-binding protein n=1 Tax=Pseudovirgaria hyperparasitica TaxID=470096 RepID=A0A6A6WBU5_9PEZI|nr:NAD(P)-binding protein [Pseudovirgaria hyperparasitica]KAF2760163.1 NAD(P)-binding protein [Pseudovirgaria hyperparasitica]